MTTIGSRDRMITVATTMVQLLGLKVALFLALGVVTHIVLGLSHWVTTDGGRIQAMAHSPYRLTRPHDLITLLDQEARQAEVTRLYNVMVSRRDAIDASIESLEDVTKVEERIVGQTKDCLVGNVDMVYYIIIASNGSEVMNYSDLSLYHEEIEGISPDCRKFASPPSVDELNADEYYHVDVLVGEKKFMVPAVPILKALMPVATVNQFGQEILSGLQRNRTSWLHYNWGALYWWIHGDGPMAIECVRRAIRFVNREMKYVPMLNLAGLLSEAGRGYEAIGVLNVAKNLAPCDAPEPIVGLAYAHATLGNFNQSVAHFDKYLRLRPNDQRNEHARAAVVCQLEIERGLKSLLDSVQRVLEDLHAFQELQHRWMSMQERSQWETELMGVDSSLYSYVNAQKCRRNDDGKFVCNQMFTRYFVKEMTELWIHQLDEQHHKIAEKLQSDAVNHRHFVNQLTDLKKDFDDDGTLLIFNSHDIAIEMVQVSHEVSDESGRVEKHKEDIIDNVSCDNEDQSETVMLDFDDDLQKENEAVVSKQPIKDETEHSIENEIKSTDPMVDENDKFNDMQLSMEQNSNSIPLEWSLEEDCSNLPNEQEELDKYPVFLSPEHKRYQIRKMLSDLIDVPANVEHPLPWYPPICDDDGDQPEKKLLLTDLNFNSLPDIAPSKYLEEHLFSFSSHSDKVNQPTIAEAEIGQRIFSALKKKSGPSYVLRTVASLYWRVRGQAYNALRCLNLDEAQVPQQYRDVLFVSIASTLLQTGNVKAALPFALEAYKMNHSEPNTNFLLGTLHQLDNNPQLAMKYMRRVLLVDGQFYNGRARHLFRLWSCRKNGGMQSQLIHEVQELSKKAQTQQNIDTDPLSVDKLCGTNSVDDCVELHKQLTDTLSMLPDRILHDTDCTDQREVNGLQSGKQCANADEDTCDFYDIYGAFSNMNERAADVVQMYISDQHPKCKLMYLDGKVTDWLRTTQSSKVAPFFADTMVEKILDLGSNRLVIKIPNVLETIKLGDIYASIPIMNMYHVDNIRFLEQSGTYTIPLKTCKVLDDADMLLSVMYIWKEHTARGLHVVEYMKPVSADAKWTLPRCSPKALKKSTATFDELESMAMVRSHSLPKHRPDTYLSALLMVVCGGNTPLIEIGIKLYAALQANSTSWVLATTAALYWRMLGNAQEAIVCLRQAILDAPADLSDIPMIYLAIILDRIGYHKDAHHVAKTVFKLTNDAKESRSALVYYTLASIFESLDDVDNAFTYNRLALSLNPNYEPARRRLQSLFCNLLIKARNDMNVE